MLSLSEMPEQTLPQLCSCLLELSPDLSHSTAATLIKSLLLGKVPHNSFICTLFTLLTNTEPRQAALGWPGYQAALAWPGYQSIIVLSSKETM